MTPTIYPSDGCKCKMFGTTTLGIGSNRGCPIHDRPDDRGPRIGDAIRKLMGKANVGVPWSVQAERMRRDAEPGPPANRQTAGTVYSDTYRETRASILGHEFHAEAKRLHDEHGAVRARWTEYIAETVAKLAENNPTPYTEDPMPENPYRRTIPTDGAYYTGSPRYHDRAQGFTTEQIDRMLREAFTQGALVGGREATADVREQLAEAWDEGLSAGRDAEATDVEVMYGQRIHEIHERAQKVVESAKVLADTPEGGFALDMYNAPDATADELADVISAFNARSHRG